MKLSNVNVDKMMEFCTKKEIDLLIFMGQFQDNFGVIKGINYKDAMAAIGISKSTFYKLMEGLEAKGMVTVNRRHADYAYWELTIVDNVFDTKDDYKKGYLRLNHEILHSDSFKKMTKSEKVIVIHLLRIADFSSQKIKVTWHTLKNWTGKSQRSVKKFVQTLGMVFKIIKLNNAILIDKFIGFDLRVGSEKDVRNRHLINFALKRTNCRAEERDIRDSVTVFKQFKIDVADKIIQLLKRSINQFGTLAPAYLNKLAQITP